MFVSAIDYSLETKFMPVILVIIIWIPSIHQF
jgi:hypothetical protein